MKRPLRLILFAFISLAVAFGSGCTGSKKLSKKAATLEDEGRYQEAARLYYESLQRNRDNLDARVGLGKTGQLYLDDKLADFGEQRRADQLKEAVYTYQDAELYKESVSYLGVELSIPTQYKLDYKAVLDEYLKKRYSEGKDLLASKQFEEAQKAFNEIEKLSPNYKDLEELKKVSECEPLYQEAKSEIAGGKYRSAYYKLTSILDMDPEYKDSKLLRDEALELGRFTVSVKPFDANGHSDIANWIEGHLLSELTSVNDPFLRIVQRENMDQILEEHELSSSAMVDGQTATQLGQVLGAQAILTGKVLSYSSNESSLRSKKEKAYKQYRVKLYNKAEDEHYYETRHKPIYYMRYYQSNEVKLAVEYKLVSLETGEVIFSEIFDKSTGDEINYSTYQGEITNLVPIRNNSPYTARSAVRQFQNSFRARRNLTPTSSLRENLMKNAASSVSRDVQSYLEQR